MSVAATFLLEGLSDKSTTRGRSVQADFQGWRGDRAEDCRVPGRRCGVSTHHRP